MYVVKHPLFNKSIISTVVNHSVQESACLYCSATSQSMLFVQDEWPEDIKSHHRHVGFHNFLKTIVI